MGSMNRVVNGKDSDFPLRRFQSGVISVTEIRVNIN